MNHLDLTEYNVGTRPKY